MSIERTQVMKKSGVGIFVFTFSILACFSAYASDTKKTMDHSTHTGKKIHETNVQGYRLAYHLLELPGRAEHHLVTYIIDPNGKPVSQATVGYLVVGPDGTSQKVMAMAMNDAFGGDVNFTAKGKYTVKSKAVLGDQKLLDSFNFEVE